MYSSISGRVLNSANQLTPRFRRRVVTRDPLPLGVDGDLDVVDQHLVRELGVIHRAEGVRRDPKIDRADPHPLGPDVRAEGEHDAELGLVADLDPHDLVPGVRARVGIGGVLAYRWASHQEQPCQAVNGQLFH